MTQQQRHTATYNTRHYIAYKNDYASLVDQAFRCVMAKAVNGGTHLPVSLDIPGKCDVELRMMDGYLSLVLRKIHVGTLCNFGFPNVLRIHVYETSKQATFQIKAQDNRIITEVPVGDYYPTSRNTKPSLSPHVRDKR